ncbi:MAG: pilus assembly protein [Desulfuromonadaceae bacterium]|nr:pilus assembly protein [Desulfuromonadaceae bacterium]
MKVIFSENGATSVEFAVIAVLLLTLIFGVIDFGLLFYNRQVLTNAAREGARRGVIIKIPRVTVTEIQNRVLYYCQDNLVTGGSNPGTALKQPIVSYGDMNANSVIDRGDILAVEAEYTYDFFVISYLGIGPKLLKAEVKMIME